MTKKSWRGITPGDICAQQRGKAVRGLIPGYGDKHEKEWLGEAYSEGCIQTIKREKKREGVLHRGTYTNEKKKAERGLHWETYSNMKKMTGWG